MPLFQLYRLNRRLQRDADMESIKVSLLPLGKPFAAPSPEAALTAGNLLYPQHRPHLCIGEHHAENLN